MQLPPYIVVLAAFFSALFICVVLHLFVRSRTLAKPKAPGASRSEDLDPSNCAALILNQITQVQTFPHPSPAGRQNTEQLAELLLSSRLYYPSSKNQLEAFAVRLPATYEDEGPFLMLLMELRKWVGANLKTPELG